MKRNRNIDAFFALLRAGLWSDGNQEIRIDGTTGWQEMYQLAEEQSVLGVVLAGIERMKNANLNLRSALPLDLFKNLNQELLLQWIGEVQVIEQQNKAMNRFIAMLVEKMRDEGIYTLLVKGQGIAQCYERPLWRVSGDVDLFLDAENYQRARKFLLASASDHKPERRFSKEQGMNIGPWYVETHGTLRTGLSTRLDSEIDNVQQNVFGKGQVRVWANDKAQVFLPAPNEDVFFVFTHFIKHFYKEKGASIRQVCDWCRLLWTYRSEIDAGMQEKWLLRSGLMGEWHAFATLAVERLGMPVEAMPFYEVKSKKLKIKYRRKANEIADFILKGGEWRKWHDTLAVGRIFPISTFRFLPGILFELNWLKIKDWLFKS